MAITIKQVAIIVIIIGIVAFIMAGWPLMYSPGTVTFPDSWASTFSFIGIAASICGVLLYIHAVESKGE